MVLINKKRFGLVGCMLLRHVVLFRVDLSISYFCLLRHFVSGKNSLHFNQAFEACLTTNDMFYSCGCFTWSDLLRNSSCISSWLFTSSFLCIASQARLRGVIARGGNDLLKLDLPVVKVFKIYESSTSFLQRLCYIEGA